MRLAHLAAAVVLVGLLTGLLGAAGPARADGPPESSEPPAERWSADPRLWLALIEWRQRLRLELASSRELCTAGTLTEVSWQISGGKPPYALQVEGVPVDVDADNVRINCGARSEAEAADEDASLAAKRVTATVTDARGVRREAALDVARARALPAPLLRRPQVWRTHVIQSWVDVPGARTEGGTARYLIRFRTLGQAAWSYTLAEQVSPLRLVIAGFGNLTPGVEYEHQVATLRDQIEQLTPHALNWTAKKTATTATTPAGVQATATHNTVTVMWDDQPSVSTFYIDLYQGSVNSVGLHGTIDTVVSDARSFTFTDLDPSTSYLATVSVDGDAEERLSTTVGVTTGQAPPNWTPTERRPVIVQTRATNDTIELSWIAPYAGAPPLYIVEVEHPTDPRVYVEWVHDTTVTLSRLSPATAYTIRVRHQSLHGGDASVVVTTAPLATQRQTLSTGDLPFPNGLLQYAPSYSRPYRFDADLRMTDDEPGESDKTFGTVATHSREATPDETTVLRYNAYDAAGEAASAGSYAFLIDAASVVATYEGLRDGTAKRLLIHKSDTQGVSRATLYDAVAAGDFFEWRETDDCWVRYRVTEVLPDPAGGAPRKLLAVEWTTYAFTGCSGVIAVNAAVVFDWGPLPDLGGPSLASPVVHGPYQLVPEGWRGAVQEPRTYSPPGYSAANPTYTRDLAAARQLPYWRDPTLPAGWTFSWATTGDVSGPTYGYWAVFATERGEHGLTIFGYYADYRGHPEEASWRNARGAFETRTIAGRPARVAYSPPGPSHDDLFPVTVWIYDPSTETEYAVLGQVKRLHEANVHAVIAIARSLFEE